MNQIETGYIDTWHLNKIITTDGREIKFNYKRETSLLTSSEFYYADGIKKSGKMTKYDSFQDIFGSPAVTIKANLLQTPSYLQSIFSEHCNIVFYSSESNQLPYPIPQNINETSIPHQSKWMKLDSICIKTKDNSIVKRIKFNYTNNTTERLKLLSVTESGTQDANSDPQYSFIYNTQKKLPSYDTYQIDHWGYYNGKTYSPTSPSGIQADRSEVDIDCLKAEILEKIIYPTGGQAIFDYEAHEYGRYIAKPNLTVANTNNTITGGLRIRKITLLNSDQSIIKETSYLYVSNYASGGTKSSGILAGVPEYFDEYSGKFDTQYPNYTYYYYEFSDQNPGPLSFTNGSHITYSEVVEKVSGNGFTIHSFTNFDTNSIYLDKITYQYQSATQNEFPISSMAYIRGKPLTQRIYSEDKKLLNETVNEYSTPSEDEYVSSVPFKTFLDVWFFFTHKIYTGKHNLIKQTNKTNSTVNTDFISTTEEYAYNSKNLLSRASIRRSDGKNQITKFVYPFEIKHGPDSTVMQKMTNRNMLSNYVEKVVFSDNNDRVIEGEYRKYHEVKADSGIFKPERVDLLFENGIPIFFHDLYPTIYGSASVYIQAISSPPHDGEFTITSLPYGSTDNDTATVVIAANFKQTVNNSPGFNFTIYTQQMNQVYTVNIQSWHMKMIGNNYVYDDTVKIQLPPGNYVAKLSDYSQASNVQYDGNISISYVKQASTMVPKYSLFKPEIYYQYDTKGNITESKPAGSNVPTTYLWGYKNQYPVAKIENATFDQVKTALGGQTVVDRIANAVIPSDTDSTLIYNLRTKPALSNAQVTTYMYKPLVGLRTMIDPRLVKTTYEYDDFGRLQAI
ncbi:MAG: hypothetical protein LBO74_03320, partial [Candidatus Symbiothrix sp.]|nr:hypothetical protein [Candidatus Symbiothrix sp.]